MKDSLCKLVRISGVMGMSLIGWLPGAGIAQGDLIQGQEVALTECSGWIMENTTAPATERNAAYWFVLGLPTHPPGGHFRFRTEFPRARYMSWQNHDLWGNSTALLADTEIVPDRGENPFLPNTPYSAGSAYTVDLLDVPPEARPLKPPRPANVLYGGYRYDGRETEYNSVAYRVYLPDPGTDSLGGVPRPEFYFVVDDPAKTSQEDIHKMCEKTRQIQEAENQLLIAVVQGTQSIAARQNRPLSDAEKTELGQRVIDGPSAEGGSPPSASDSKELASYRAVTPDPNGRGTYYNAHTGYLEVFLNATREEVTVMRFRAPIFPDTQGLQDPQGIPDDISGNEQLRYWSLCMHDATAGLSTSGCLYDAQVAQDGDGYVTVAFSNPESRPANAVNWLPTSGTIPALILRHMQPNPAFTEALLYYAGTDNDAAAIAAHMGEYFPHVTTCAKAEFERNRCGLDP